MSEWVWSLPCARILEEIKVSTHLFFFVSLSLFYSDSYIVRVKAVVMTRDDSSGGWLAQEGGGLSRVGVCKVTPAELSGHSDFLIHGERLKDKRVTWLIKQFILHIVGITLHHWHYPTFTLAGDRVPDW